MTNKGLLGNAPSDVWRYYDPTPRLAYDYSGSLSTVPVFDTVDGRTYQFGRYVVEDDGLVVAEIQSQLIGNSIVGNASTGNYSAYVWRLPFPAKRMTGPGTVSPIPIGSAMCYMSFNAPNYNVACIPTLANPFKSLSGAEDSFVQLYAPYFVTTGADTIASGASSKATTYCTSAQAMTIPHASDIEVRATDGNVGVGTPFFFIDTIGTGSFTVNTRAGTTAAMGYGYKVRSDIITTSATNLAPVVNPAYPFDWIRFTSLGPFGNFFIQVAYERADQ